MRTRNMLVGTVNHRQDNYLSNLCSIATKPSPVLLTLSRIYKTRLKPKHTKITRRHYSYDPPPLPIKTYNFAAGFGLPVLVISLYSSDVKKSA